jgi:hypothetical protein
MRLTKNLARTATSELLEILRKNPAGLRTSELCGTSRFRGKRKLRNRQIVRLLNESGKVTTFIGDQGNRIYYLWRLKREAAEQRGAAR